MNKTARYNRIYNQLVDLLKVTDNPISRMATIAALLHHKFDYYFWTGFYLLKDNGKLLVGPYQGPLACQELKKNTGVCWHAINTQETAIVKDVEQFPGHIACSSLSKSEIVVPIFNKNNITGVLDIDSKSLASFDEEDKTELEKIAELVFV